MKKIDLHIHTVKSESDAYFEFNLEKLLDYVFAADLESLTQN